MGEHNNHTINNAKIISISELALNQESEVGYSAAKAIETFRTQKVPFNKINQRPGANGKMFTYVKHTYITDLLNAGLPGLWSTDILDKTIFDDGSASVTMKLTVDIPQPHLDNKYTPRHITEVGSFKGNDYMAHSDKIAAAASRALCRCVFRMFGIGKEFYEQAEETTPNQAWQTIRNYADNQNINIGEISIVYKNVGITKENLVERFAEAYQLAGNLHPKFKNKRKTPPDLLVGVETHHSVRQQGAL